MLLENKVAVVTGAAQGIGRGIARVFAEEGASVALLDVDVAAADRAATALVDAPGETITVEADVTDPDSVRDATEAVAEEFGGVDVVVANAGIYPDATLEELDAESWDAVQDVNLKGAFLTVKAALPYLKESAHGRVLLTSSITGPITGYPGWSHYGATKAGMLGFMRTAAIELADNGVTVNAVLPGNVLTESLDDLGEDYIEQMTASIPLGELGVPADIGHAMAFLASERAGYITGQSLVVDGGQTLPESLMALDEG
jgi:3-oxoacyl-[acyl-carrier protein] reductase